MSTRSCYKLIVGVLCLQVLLLLSCCSSGVAGQSLQGIEIPSYGDDEDIVVHVGYVASYNHQTLLPNWVAWELTAEEVAGTCKNSFSFSRDPKVAFPKADRKDYSQSGWDKGHMAPRADMKWSEKALEESYYFTNVCPQSRSMNAGAWRKIEELTRRVAKYYGAVYVVCGPIVGTGHHGTIGPSSVQVPDAFFKALAIRTEDGYKTVGFLVDNTQQEGSPRSYAVSVDSVETVVGRNLFPLLPEVSEGVYDWKIWNH